MGDLEQTAHGISGALSIINNKTLIIRNFNYDSQGPGQWIGLLI